MIVKTKEISPISYRETVIVNFVSTVIKNFLVIRNNYKNFKKIYI